MFNRFLLLVRNNVFHGCPLEQQIAPVLQIQQTKRGEHNKRQQTRYQFGFEVEEYSVQLPLVYLFILADMLSISIHTQGFSSLSK